MTLPFEPPALRQVSPTEVEWRGRRLVYFGGSDYFRFAWHPRLRAAVARAAVVLGHNLSASRLTTGNHPLYIELERSLANFFIAPAVVLTPTGYSAPLVVGQALARRITHAFVDEQAHGCMKDAAVLSRAKVKFFRHGDAGALEESVRRCDARAKVAVFANEQTSAQLSLVQGTARRLGLPLHVVDFKRPPFDYELGFADAVSARPTRSSCWDLGSGYRVGTKLPNSP